MTAIPVPPMSRLAENEDAELFEEAAVKKSLTSAFDTPLVVKKRISRLSESFQQIPAEYIKVFLRLRPFTEKERKENEDQGCMKISDDRHILTVMAPKDSKMFKASSRGIGESVRHYTFTKIFDKTAGQREFYQETAHPLVQQFINGNNALIFTYGVTNAGKTYTLQGAPGNEGIIPQAVDVIFSQIGDKILQDVTFMPKMACNLCAITPEEKRSRNSIKDEVMSMADESRYSLGQTSRISVESSICDATNVLEEDSIANATRTQSLESFHENGEIKGPVRYAVFVSFVEVYKELVYDLLTPVDEDKRRSRPVLVIADDKKGTSYVKGMREIQVNSPQELLKILSVGQQNLHVAATKLNKDSSRSHCIFTITLVQVMDIPEPLGARVSKISFCDLAGSERANKTREAGDRLKEAGKINTSLMNLGKCIADLRHNQRYKGDKSKQRAVFFRETKLTRLFRNYLLGDGQACMVVNANMCASGFDETVHVLKFSAIAMEVQIINRLRRSGIKKKSNVTLFDETFERSADAAKRPRATIAWEKKLTPIKDVEENSAESDEELSECEGSDDSDSDDGQPPVDVSFYINREKKYLELIDMLKKALLQEKNKSKESEAAVRNQCAQFMQNQIVEIEQKHKDRIEETINILADEQQTRLDVMANLSNLNMKELKEGFEKKFWELTASNTNMEKELIECREQLSAKATELLNAEDKLTSIELEYSQLKMEVEKKDNEMTALKRRSNRSSRYSSNFDKETVIQDLVEKNEEGKSIIRSLMEELDEYRTRVEETQEENERLEKALTAAEKKRDSQELPKDSANQEEFKGLQEKLENLEKQISSLESASHALINEQVFFSDETVATEGEALKFTKGILNHLPDWLNEKEDQILQLETDIKKETMDKLSVKKQLSTVNESLEKAVAQANSLHEELAQKSDSLDKALGDKKNLESSHLQKMKDADAEIKLLEESHSKEMKILQEKFSVAERASAELKSLKEQNKGLEKEAEERKNFEQQLMKETDRLHDEVEKLKKENLEIKQASQKRSSDASEMLRDVEIITKDRDDLLARVETLQKELSESKKEKETLREEIREQLAKSTVHNNTELLELKTVLSKKDTELENLRARTDELHEGRNDLECEVQKLQGNIEKSEKAKSDLLQEMSESRAKYDKLTEAKLELEKTCEERTSEAAKLHRSLESRTNECNELSSGLEGLKRGVAEKNEEISQLNRKLEEASKDHTLEKEKVNKERTKLNEEIDQLKAEKDKVTRMKEEMNRQTVDLSDELQQKKSELEKLKASFAEFKTKTKEHIEKAKDDHEAELKAAKERQKTEMNELRSELSQVEKTVDAREKELNSFRENRDRIVAALETQISNDKSTNEVLKANLDHQMAETVRMKSQIAAATAENSEMKRRLEEKENASRMKKSISASAVLNLDPVVQVKKEPISPQMIHETLNGRASTKSPLKEAANVIHDLRERTSKEGTPGEKTKTASQRGRGRRGGSSTGSRGSKRSKRTTAARPATPLPEVPQGENEEPPSPPKKTRNSSKEAKKSIAVSIKEEATDQQGVLDDSELMKETGNSRQFPKPTIELDVTPQVKKKGAKTRKRVGKRDDQVQESFKRQKPHGSIRASPLAKQFKFLGNFVSDEDAEEATATTRSTRRTRANTNNSNSSKASDEEQHVLQGAASKNLNKVGNMLRNSPVGQALKCLEEAITPTNKSPKKAKKQPEEQHKRTRRMVKLNPDDISYPLEATPSPDQVRVGGTVPSVSETPARMIRRLRNRK